MYTVYHIPELKKVGCTSNFDRRMKQQGVEPLDEFIKFKSSSIEEASFVEQVLQKFYNYPPDTDKTYKEKIMGKQKKYRDFGNGKSKTVGLNLGIKNKESLKAYLFEGPITLRTDEVEFTYDNSAQFDYLVSTAQKSQFGTGDFYWNKIQLTKAYETISNNKESVRGHCNNSGPCIHGNTIPEFEQIREWATERGLYEKGDAKTQYLKLQEEAGEVARAILKSDEEEIIDGLGDTLVVLINLAHLAGYKLEDCLASAYDVISKRTGKMVNGTFVKTESL